MFGSLEDVAQSKSVHIELQVPLGRIDIEIRKIFRIQQRFGHCVLVNFVFRGFRRISVGHPRIAG